MKYAYNSLTVLKSFMLTYTFMLVPFQQVLRTDLADDFLIAIYLFIYLVTISGKCVKF